jgi:hypothetical protein
MADPRVPTLDAQPDRLFRLWQDMGRIPKVFTSWADLEQQYVELVHNGTPEPRAREALGVTYKNHLGNNLLQINEASDGSRRGLNKRAIREDYNIATSTHVIQNYGKEVDDWYRNELRKDWFGISETERKNSQAETGKQFHRGHGVGALQGGSTSRNNMYPEHGERNVLHGSADRWPRPVMEDIGVPPTDMADFYERKLQADGLGLVRPNDFLATAADEQMVSPTGPKTYIRDNEAGRSPESMPATQQRLNELEAQGVSRQAIENWSKDQSGTFSRGDAVQQSGPVKVVQKPVKVPVKVVEEGKTRPSSRLVSRGSAAALPNPVRPEGSKSVLNGKPVIWKGGKWVAAPWAPKPVAAKPKPVAAKPKPTAAKSNPKPVAAKPNTKPNRNKLSASENIRLLQNAVQDAIPIHPGMSLPSYSLIQGI